MCHWVRNSRARDTLRSERYETRLPEDNILLRRQSVVCTISWLGDKGVAFLNHLDPNVPDRLNTHRAKRHRDGDDRRAGRTGADDLEPSDVGDLGGRAGDGGRDCAGRRSLRRSARWGSQRLSRPGSGVGRATDGSISRSVRDGTHQAVLSC